MPVGVVVDAQVGAVYKELIQKIESFDFKLVYGFVVRQTQQGWPQERSRQALKNFQSFLVLWTIADFPLIPTPDIAVMWSTCVLHTEFYAQMCEVVFGEFVHHIPYDNKRIPREYHHEEPYEFHGKYLQKTAELFKGVTGRDYNDDFEYTVSDNGF